MPNNTFFAFIHRMKYINRWGLMKNIRYENLKEHSFDVSTIALGIAIIGNKYYKKDYNPDRIAVMGMYHDSNEAITGDMPTPIKYSNSEMTRAYKELESQATKQVLKMLPSDLKSEYIKYFEPTVNEKAVIKAADKISAYIKCLDEESEGNKDFVTAKEAIFKSIKAIELDEVKRFVSDFIPPYKLTLDQLKK